MEFVLLKTFSNYVEANITQAVLEEKGIRCHLEDENASAVIGIVSAIKLMVFKSQVERAVEVLIEAEAEYLDSVACPACHSNGFEIKFLTEDHEQDLKKIPMGDFIAVLSKLFSKEGTSHQIKHYICKNCRKELAYLPA